MRFSNASFLLSLQTGVSCSKMPKKVKQAHGGSLVINRWNNSASKGEHEKEKEEDQDCLEEDEEMVSTKSSCIVMDGNVLKKWSYYETCNEEEIVFPLFVVEGGCIASSSNFRNKYWLDLDGLLDVIIAFNMLRLNIKASLMKRFRTSPVLKVCFPQCDGIECSFLPLSSSLTLFAKMTHEYCAIERSTSEMYNDFDSVVMERAWMFLGSLCALANGFESESHNLATYKSLHSSQASSSLILGGRSQVDLLISSAPPASAPSLVIQTKKTYMNRAQNDHFQRVVQVCADLCEDSPIMMDNDEEIEVDKHLGSINISDSASIFNSEAVDYIIKEVKCHSVDESGAYSPLIASQIFFGVMQGADPCTRKLCLQKFMLLNTTIPNVSPIPHIEDIMITLKSLDSTV